MHKQSILFVYVNYSTFVKADFEILSTFANVTKYQFKPGRGIIRTGFKLIKQFLFLILNIWKYDAVFIWFADFHSLLPTLMAKILGKRSFVVVGGYEVERNKNLHYGVLFSKIRGFFCVCSIKICSLNLTVSKYLDRKVKYIATKSKRHLVSNCVDFKHIPNNPDERENLVITIGIIENELTYFRKGIDTFIEVARRLPDFQFIIIGLDKTKLTHLLTDLPGNLLIFGIISHDELPGYYRRSKFYFQLSRAESFGVVIAEAMLYGCIPVVTNEGGMPELIGNTGYIVKRNSDIISQLVRKNSLILPESQLNVSNRIKTCFSWEKRKEIIAELVSNTKVYKLSD